MRKESFRQNTLSAAALVIVSVAAAAQTPPATPAAGTAPSRSLGPSYTRGVRARTAGANPAAPRRRRVLRVGAGADRDRRMAPSTESTPEAATETERSGSGGSVAKGTVKGAAEAQAAAVRQRRETFGRAFSA